VFHLGGTDLVGSLAQGELFIVSDLHKWGIPSQQWIQPFMQSTFLFLRHPSFLFKALRSPFHALYTLYLQECCVHSAEAPLF